MRMKISCSNRLYMLSVALIMQLTLFAADNDREFQQAIRYGATAQVSVRIVDDSQKPVSGVTVESRFDAALRSRGCVVTVTTDTNGMAIVTGKTGKSVAIRATKPGYYGVSDQICFISQGQGVEEGKWKPWNVARTLVLRPVKNPVANKVPISDWRIAKTPSAWIGFDVEKYDFVKPHGNGEVADMEIKYEVDGHDLKNLDGMDIYIRFPWNYAGAYYQNRCMTSDFKDAYFAATNAVYLKDFHFFDHKLRDGHGHVVRHDKQTFDNSKAMIVRSRCVVDEEGGLKEARYSEITHFRFGCDENGCCLMFQPIFNPTPNDPNLEPKW